MKTIHKYTLHADDIQTVNMPIGAVILDAQEQGYGLQLWALVDDSKPLVPRQFASYGTWLPVPEEAGEYVATVQMSNLVWHIFEVTNVVQS